MFWFTGKRSKFWGQNEGGDLVTCACRMVYLANSLQLKAEMASIAIIMVFKFEAFLRTVVLRHMLMNLTCWSVIYDDFMLDMVTLINYNNNSIQKSEIKEGESLYIWITWRESPNYPQSITASTIRESHVAVSVCGPCFSSISLQPPRRFAFWLCMVLEGIYFKNKCYTSYLRKCTEW